MAQTRSQRLQIVLQMAEQKEEAAQQELAKIQQRLKSEQDKLEQLQQFQQEYQNNLRAQTGRRISPAQYQTLSAFISRLSVAIQEQRRQIEFVGNVVARAQEKWRELYQKRKNMSDFIDRCRDQEAREADKREQRLMDEAAMQAAVLRRR